jgi:hypothetical protein
VEEPSDRQRAEEPVEHSSLVDDLVAQLRARVEARRAAGVYPAGLEDEMSAHFQRILHLRRGSRPVPDATSSVRAAGDALPIQAARIPLESGVPGGEVLHKTIARLVGRQTNGALQQVQAFAQPAQAALEELNAAVRELTRLLTVDVAQSLDVIYERQANSERLLAAAGIIGPPEVPGKEDDAATSEDFAARLADCDPTLTVAGEQGLRDLRPLEDKALGGLALVGMMDSLRPENIVELVALAADKVRPGGRVVAGGGGRHCVHPAYLTFLFREAGFAAVDVEWRSPPPADISRRLNELLFAPRGYVLAAVR